MSNSDNSISEFERNFWVLLPDLHDGTKLITSEQPQGTRRNRRPKKPSSRFNEDARFLAEPPKSAKKNVLKGDILEDTATKPLLISNWSDVKISSYCNACGINFAESTYVFITHIRILEKTHITPSRSLAATFSEVREF